MDINNYKIVKSIFSSCLSFSSYNQQLFIQLFLAVTVGRRTSAPLTLIYSPLPCCLHNPSVSPMSHPPISNGFDFCSYNVNAYGRSLSINLTDGPLLGPFVSQKGARFIKHYCSDLFKRPRFL